VCGMGGVCGMRVCDSLHPRSQTHNITNYT